VIHNYRWRPNVADGDPQYDGLEKRLAEGPVIWTRNSPNWHFDDATFDRSAQAFDNPDYVEVVIHSYRHRPGLAAGYPQYEDFERRLAAQPTITVPTITLDGNADGVVPATDGK
jgi:hypothetical protein